ncbi:hypothetical protein CRYUN_Cryun03dG0100900 [Craigia yunnanensis]
MRGHRCAGTVLKPGSKSFRPRNLDLFFTSVSAATVSSGEVFTSMAGLFFRMSKLKDLHKDEEKVASILSRSSSSSPQGNTFDIIELGIALVSLYLSLVSTAREVLKRKVLKLFTFSVFATVSTFASCGFVHQILMFCLMEWKSEAITGLNPLEKIVGLLFQSVNPRHTGETIIDLSIISPAILVLLVVMMYLPPYTSFIWIISNEQMHSSEKCEDKKRKGKIVKNLIMSQLSYLSIFVILICITERQKMKEDPLNFNVLNIVVEVIR